MKRTLLAILLAAVAVSAQAQQKKSVVIHPSIPPVESVKDAPFPGWLELGAAGKTFYMSQDGRYMMLGKVVDLGVQGGAGAGTPDASGAQTAQEPGPIDVSKLPLKQAIKYVNGNGKRTLYVFSDPDCPYCRKLEQEIGEVANTTIYVFPYPLDSIHPQASAHAQALWCADDRAKAWRDTMVSNRLINLSQAKSCVNPVAANVALGQSLGIIATPTIFTQDGRRIIGYVPAQQISEYMGSK